jgi:hypothetical protein
MNFSKGDIVIIPIPFTDNKGTNFDLLLLFLMKMFIERAM